MTDDRGAVFALLDDCGATAVRRASRLYTGFRHERVCTDATRLEAVCDAVSADLRAGLHAVVLADYAFGAQIVFGRPPSHAGAPPEDGAVPADAPSLPHAAAALRILLFAHCERLADDDVRAWLAGVDGGAHEPGVAGAARVRASVDAPQFGAAIDAIHAALREGDSYQVNYTYRLAFDAFGSPVALYRRLRERQPVPYGALIALPGDHWVLSCSPELFVEKRGTLLRTRPMKGTAPRHPDDARADRQAADFLARDPKNRAENVMIVDLLRNDLSRVAETGSVTVPALFAVEPYASVWQMTSTVEARLPASTPFAEVLRALFPCGSITGAPKHRTMQLVEALESTPRGLYTGAIGWLDAPAGHEPAACGDFCLSVAIRTLTLQPAAADTALRPGTLGVGAGIVLDSVAAEEYAECQLKARFFTEADPGFALFETVHATREAGVRHLERHLARLAASAAWLGFMHDEAALRAQLAAQCAALPAGQPHRVRLALAKDGAVQIGAAPLAPLGDPVAGVLLAPEHGFAPTDATDPLLRHKTTRRADYDRAWRAAEAQGGFDVLFFNTRGELTEGGRSNVFVQIDGRWWTPPVASGVLPGVMRAVLLDDPALGAAERVLTLDDVRRAQALMICNALRGALPARIL
jgi:para-aminobenzoate synthetase/4-amino-4-deoxychorismate lyase